MAANMLTDDETNLLNKLKDKFNSFSKSITLLNQNNCDQQAFILLFTYLDQLGWLTSDGDFSNGADFKRWVDTYLDVSKLNCNSQDLWNARCSLVHMDTAQSQRFNPKIHSQLAFYKNVELSEENRKIQESRHASPTKYVDVGILFDEFDIGLRKFVLDIFIKKELRDKVLNKVQQMTDYIILN